MGHRHPKTGIETWYNLDSKKPKPQWFESAKHATRFIQRELREKGGEMLICREKPLPIYKRPMLDQKDDKDDTNEHGESRDMIYGSLPCTLFVYRRTFGYVTHRVTYPNVR